MYHKCCPVMPHPCHMQVMTQPKPVCCVMAPEMTMTHMEMPAPHQFETCKQVIEPCVSCTQEYHHHHKVEHVVPVVVKNIHCHHNHHCYMIDKKECEEAFCLDHGIRQEDWCALAKANCQYPKY